MIDEEPGLERRLPAEPAELLERRHEGLLRHVVGLGGRPDRRQGRPEHRPPVPLDQLAERLDVAGLGPADQGEVRAVAASAASVAVTRSIEGSAGTVVGKSRMKPMLNSEQLLAAIRDKVEHPATARELLQRLKIPREQRATVKRLLKGLVEAGHLVQTRGNRFGLPDRMNLVVGRVQTHPRGFGFVIPDQPVEGVAGDIFIAGANLNQAMHGDRVVARIEQRRERPRRRAHRPHPRARLHDASSAASRWTTPALGYLVPFDRRLIMDVHDRRRGARRRRSPATWWSSRSRGGRRRRAARSGASLEVLGDIEEPGVDTEIIIRKYGIPDEHSDEAVAEATRLGGAVKEKDIKRAHRLPADHAP